MSKAKETSKKGVISKSAKSTEIDVDAIKLQAKEEIRLKLEAEIEVKKELEEKAKKEKEEKEAKEAEEKAQKEAEEEEERLAKEEEEAKILKEKEKQALLESEKEIELAKQRKKDALEAKQLAEQEAEDKLRAKIKAELDEEKKSEMAELDKEIKRMQKDKARGPDEKARLTELMIQRAKWNAQQPRNLDRLMGSQMTTPELQKYLDDKIKEQEELDTDEARHKIEVLTYEAGESTRKLRLRVKAFRNPNAEEKLAVFEAQMAQGRIATVPLGQNRTNH